jgi:general L-amino acid transport system substrate-binding protein
MLRILNFRLLGLVGLLCPGALGATEGNGPECGDVKAFYKEKACCGNPSKVVDVGSLCGGGSTIDKIHQRGVLICGVKGSQFGMGFWDEANQEYKGLDIEYCKAVAAAMGVQPDYVIASASDRFEKLAAKDIDVLIRTTTYTKGRDVDLKADFAGINFFDGQSILVNDASFPAGGKSALQLNGAKVCVEEGSTSKGNVVDYFAANMMTLELVLVQSAADGEGKFLANECDAITGDKSALVATKYKFDQTNSGVATWITTELLSKEPLAAATRDDDADFNSVVKWVWYGMVTAEEMGITKSNYETVAMDSCEGGQNENPQKCGFLTQNLGLGTNEHPLDPTWMQHVLKEVGNYGEAYSKAFCDGTYDGTSGSDSMTGCLIMRTGGNALVSENGLQFAPPMRR